MREENEFYIILTSKTGIKMNADKEGIKKKLKDYDLLVESIESLPEIFGRCTEDSCLIPEHGRWVAYEIELEKKVDYNRIKEVCNKLNILSPSNLTIGAFQKLRPLLYLKEVK